MQAIRWKIFLVLAGLAISAAANRSLPAADSAAPSDGHSSTAAASPARDPVASAFALPKGVVLSPQQKTAYDQLKQEREPILRKAIDQVHESKGEAMLKAAREVRDQRAEIRTKIDEILNTPYDRSAKSSGDSSGSSDPANSPGSTPPYTPNGPMPYYYPYPYHGYHNPNYSTYYYYPTQPDKGKTVNPGVKKPQNPVKPRSAPVASSTAKH
jgi:hypothetical protein